MAFSTGASTSKRDADPEHHNHGHHHGYHHVRYENHNHPVGPHKCKDITQQVCTKIPHHNAKDVCEVIVDVTYIEECEDVISTHCHEDYTEVHHESHVVGHDTHVVGHHGYHRRDADNHHHHHHHGPKCHDKHHSQCHKVPKDHSHKVCNTLVSTTTTEECKNIATAHCEYDDTHSHKEAHVIGHHSLLV